MSGKSLSDRTYRTNFTFRKETTKKVSVQLGRGMIADIRTVVGILKPDKCFVLCDSTIDNLYANDIVANLQQDMPTYKIVHLPNEENKNFTSLTQISNEFFAHKGSKSSVIIALGGGVTGNIAGLFASTAYRGIRLVHVPTTLLAQLDSAVDVKQSINASGHKNALGSYFAPDIVVIDTDFLVTLSDREFRAGIGEAVKHGLAQDMDFVEFLLANDFKDNEVQQRIISRTIELKLEHWRSTPTIWNDTHEVVRLTHLGHTTGKVLEMIDVDHLTHGEAIAHGMAIEIHMSNLLGFVDTATVQRVYEVLSSLDLLYPLSDVYSPECVTQGLFKYSSTPPLFALSKGLGNPNVESTSVPKATVEQSLHNHFDYIHQKLESNR